MAEIHGGTNTSDADQIMVRRERGAIAVGVLDEQLRAVGFSPPREEKAREFWVMRLSMEPIYGFYLLLNWYLNPNDAGGERRRVRLQVGNGGVKAIHDQ